MSGGAEMRSGSAPIDPATAPADERAFDVAIIGAGPAGAAAAILLARAGWSVALVEKQAFPRRKVCGECIAASNLPLLEGLGLAPDVLQRAGPELRTVALARATTWISAAMPPAAHARLPYGRALGRETLDPLLVEQARRGGATVLQPWAVQSIAGGPGDWQLDIRAVHGRETRQASGPVDPPVTPPGSHPGSHPGSQPLRRQLRCRVAIAAHGSWETLPTGREARRARRAPGDLFAFKANFRDARLAPGCLPVLALDGGYGGMVLADGGVTTLACCVRRDRLDGLRAAAPGLPAGEVVERWLRAQCAAVDRALTGARRDGPWLASGPIDPGMRLRADDRLLRIGNAAGEVHPILGEGISMALQSAGLLCAELLADADPRRAAEPAWQAAVARRYARVWRRQFSGRLLLGAALAHLAMRPLPAYLLAQLAQRWPGLLTATARWGGKVHCAADADFYRRAGSAA